MTAYLFKRVPWEYELLDGPLSDSQRKAGWDLQRQRGGVWNRGLHRPQEWSPPVEEEASESSVHREEARARVADKVAVWPELYEPQLGGTAGQTVDLAPLWRRLIDLSAERGEYEVYPDSQMLADEAGGLAQRLCAGLRSLDERAPVYVQVSYRAEKDENQLPDSDGIIDVTMWSDRGHPDDDDRDDPWPEAWWAHAQIEVTVDDDYQASSLARGAEFIVARQRRGRPVRRPGGIEYTRFVDGAESCEIGNRIAEAFETYLAGVAIRRTIARQPAWNPKPISAEEFLASL